MIFIFCIKWTRRWYITGEILLYIASILGNKYSLHIKKKYRLVVYTKFLSPFVNVICVIDGFISILWFIHYLSSVTFDMRSSIPGIVKLMSKYLLWSKGLGGVTWCLPTSSKHWQGPRLAARPADNNTANNERRLAACAAWPNDTPTNNKLYLRLMLFALTLTYSQVFASTTKDLCRSSLSPSTGLLHNILS